MFWSCSLMSWQLVLSFVVFAWLLEGMMAKQKLPEQYPSSYPYPHLDKHMKEVEKKYASETDTDLPMLYHSNYNSNINNNNKFGQMQSYQQQPMQRHQNAPMSGNRNNNNNVSTTERIQRKCRVWVPTESVSKYKLATVQSTDQSKHLQLIEICCPGYGPVRWLANTLCRPLCDNCQNGLCVAPGQCQCYEEYVKNDNGDCVFTCPLGCLNGRCYLDGSCQCDPGYKMDETRSYCRPICSAGCGSNPRHNCTEPEVCGCAKGYRLTDDNCQPTCTPDCGVGGICTEYNSCECKAGFTLKHGVCQADCYQKCDNGTCYGRNRCICNPGFSYHEKSTQCIPT